MEGLVTGSNAPTTAFWNGRRVFVTGHTGFKGAWLCLWLQRLGAHVAGFSLPPAAEPNLFDQARVSEGMTSRFGDIRDLEDLSRSVADHRAEIILHLAAQALVRPSYDDPVGTFLTNVQGTVHVLEAARRSPTTRAVLVVTSDKCYANVGWEWGYRENDPLGGHDPYSASKACAEMVAASWRASFATGSAPAIATARAGNVIGGGDWSVDRLVPDMARAFLGNHPVTLRNPDHVRPWQHVLEPLSAYLCIAEALCSQPERASAAWNIGPSQDHAWPVETLARQFASDWGDGAQLRVLREGGQRHEASILMLDSSRIRRRLGWSSRWALPRAIAETAAWYRAFRDGDDMRAVTLDHITRYGRSAITDTPPIPQAALEPTP
ncbi:CDP-glucose 4,6-dehydratase [Azospirillum tabaci]|uniref:CDP-glucose 4,6-dehydratase n=1 Tax=Azospirillum tabaci TaxID=2752310 RepID=UPI0031B5DDA2